MHLRVAAYAVVIDSERILLSRLRETRARWTLPGGGIDPGEHPADAAVREVREETGYDVELDELLGIDSIVIAGPDLDEPADDDLQGLRIVYRAHVVGGTLQDEADGSTDAAAWIDLADLPTTATVELVDAALAMLVVPRA
ncbi:NUDIX hydrolase [Cellulomonas sp. PhB150]|uniref:NUDIX hydrolase n=1 Tax=Cellulomonas sp. PhB150 TaxID=2485188 RepID=UPI000F484B91|nr:NUDIX hydrolase [Cellulomonas sp. PhB150]ROS30392.1 ADP-ribose pyrophosphatase YjhB (NUDIX family) [Cellulomonas sp. PhB150]